MCYYAPGTTMANTAMTDSMRKKLSGGQTLHVAKMPPAIPGSPHGKDSSLILRVSMPMALAYLVLADGLPRHGRCANPAAQIHPMTTKAIATRKIEVSAGR